MTRIRCHPTRFSSNTHPARRPQLFRLDGGTEKTLRSADCHGTVLVVDDNTMLLDSVSAMLQMIGWSVTKASGGVEALRLMKQSSQSFDLVLLDLLMPDLNGYEVLKRMRDDGNSSPVVLTSGCGEVRTDGAQLASVWLNKPFRLEELQEAIAKARADQRDG